MFVVLTSHIGETKRFTVRGEGSSKDVTYIPKDVQEKKEKELKKREQESKQYNDGETVKRKRRVIKEIGFKTQFKNQN
jgi:hypothetical protein